MGGGSGGNRRERESCTSQSVTRRVLIECAAFGASCWHTMLRANAEKQLEHCSNWGPWSCHSITAFSFASASIKCFVAVAMASFPWRLKVQSICNASSGMEGIFNCWPESVLTSSTAFWLIITFPSLESTWKSSLLLKLATVLTPGGLPLFLAQDFCFTVSRLSGPEVVAQPLASLLMPFLETLLDLRTLNCMVESTTLSLFSCRFWCWISMVLTAGSRWCCKMNLVLNLKCSKGLQLHILRKPVFKSSSHLYHHKRLHNSIIHVTYNWTPKDLQNQIIWIDH
jgi:hypothetical protein